LTLVLPNHRHPASKKCRRFPGWQSQEALHTENFYSGCGSFFV